MNHAVIKASGMMLVAVQLLAFALPMTARAQDNPQDPAAGEQMHHRHGPPPEVLQACADKAAGAACSFTGREGRTISGLCAPPPHASADNAARLACRPEGGPPPGEMPPPPGS